MIISQTPLRISFVGGGTDLPEYYERHEHAGVISTAIDKYVYVILKDRFDSKIRVGYTRTELVDAVDQLQHELVRESLRCTGIDRGVEISTMADVPAEGSGLGSSSSVTVGLLNAMYTHQGNPQTLEVLARQAADIEIAKLRHPVGKQDQYIAAFGGLREILFHQDGRVAVRTLEVAPKTLRQLQQNLLLLYTGVTRKASEILEEQRGSIEARLEVHHRLCSLRERLRHVLETPGADLDDFGRILNESWQAKKGLSPHISNSWFDELYERALRNGALGGKILGAGGGGFFLFYVPAEEQERLISALAMRVLPMRFDNVGTRIVLNVHR